MSGSHRKLIATLVGLALFAVVATGLLGERALRANPVPADLAPLLSSLRTAWLAAAAIAVAVALLIGVALSGSLLRPIREMRRMASAIAAGDLSYRLPLRFGDELGEIAAALQRMSEQLRERAELATREKEQLQAVLNGMVEGVLVVDPEQRILLGNQQLRDFFGVAGELRGRTALEAIRHAELAAVLKAAENADEPVSRAIEVAHPAHRTLRVHAVRLPPAGDAHAGTVAVLHDVTELMQLEKMRREFVANASHELRTPAGRDPRLRRDAARQPRALRRRSARLPRGDRPPRAPAEQRWWATCSSSRRSRAARRTSSEPRSTSTSSRRRCSTTGDRVSTRSSSPPRSTSERPAVAWADAQSCEQILSNLLDNAIKYTEPGGGIALRIGGDERSVRIDVADTGMGIPQRDLGRIFERFYRVDQARSRSQGGTGLGLAIVKHLVQSLDGEIEVESQLGRGSTFSVSLPRQS